MGTRRPWTARRAMAALSGGVLPVAVLFVLTAHPALLYAEAGVPFPSCTAAGFDACVGKVSGDRCDDAGETCASADCFDTDGGPTTALECVLAAGDDAGDGGGSVDAGSDASETGDAAAPPPGRDAGIADSGALPADAAAPRDSGATAANPQTGSAGGGGCSAASQPAPGFFGAAASALVAIALARRARSKRRGRLAK